MTSNQPKNVTKPSQNIIKQAKRNDFFTFSMSIILRVCINCNCSPMVWRPRATIWGPSRRRSVALQLFSKSLSGSLLWGKYWSTWLSRWLWWSYMPSVEVHAWQPLVFSRPRTMKAEVSSSGPTLTTVVLHHFEVAFDQSLPRKSKIWSEDI